MWMCISVISPVINLICTQNTFVVGGNALQVAVTALDGDSDLQCDSDEFFQWWTNWYESVLLYKISTDIRENDIQHLTSRGSQSD